MNNAVEENKHSRTRKRDLEMLATESGGVSVRQDYGGLIEWVTNEQRFEGHEGVEHAIYGKGG